MGEAFSVFMLWFLGLYLVGLVLASVAHEGGHLFCARMCSIPISRMAIGCGPVLMRGRIGQLQLELRLFPVGGLVEPTTLANFEKRGPMALFFLGGILGNIAAIGAVILLHIMGAAPIVLHDQLGTPLAQLQIGILVGTQLLFIVLGLIPQWGSIDGIQVASDGVQLVRALSGRLTYAVSLGPYRRGATRLPLTSPASQRIAHQFARTDRWSNQDVRGDFHAALRRELAEGGLPAEEEMLVLDALVTDGLLFADPDLRTELDQWSLRALQLGPEVRTLLGSRGAVLVELGRYQEGKALLETVMIARDATPFDVLVSQIFLARSEYVMGNAARAGELLKQARSVVVQTSPLGAALIALIDRAEREMQSHSS